MSKSKYRVITDDFGNIIDPQGKKIGISQYELEHYKDQLEFLIEKYLLMKKLKKTAGMKEALDELENLHNKIKEHHLI